MSSTTHAAAAFLRRLSGRSSDVLDALLKGSVADQALAEVETREISRRMALLESLGKLDRAYPADQKAGDAEAAAASRAKEAAEQAFMDAKSAYRQAWMRGEGVQLTYLRARREIVDELMSSADARLADFIAHADNIRTAELPMAVKYWLEDSVNGYYRNAAQRSNMDDVTAASAAIQRAIEAAKDLQLQPVGYVEVSQALMSWCGDLAPILAKVSLNPPSLSAEHAEVGPPVGWHDFSQWVVDDVAAHAEALKAAKREAYADKAKKARP